MMWRHSLGSEEWESLNDVHRRNIGGMLFCGCGPDHKVLGTIKNPTLGSYPEPNKRIGQGSSSWPILFGILPIVF